MTKKKIQLGFSPCPNDTFMFFALVHGLIDTGGLEYEIEMSDIEDLNRRVLDGNLLLSKISYAAFPEVSDRYRILNAGSALGFRNGPLVVSKRRIYPDELFDALIAIPGEMTTANFLLQNFYPDARKKRTYLFSEIEEAVLSDEADAGLLIHESRFTYLSKGLKLVDDLGEKWEDACHLPVPLGCIVALREMGDELTTQVEKHIRESIQFAFQNPRVPLDWIKKFSRELSDEVIHQHIDLYVNSFSLELGEEGREAVNFLYEQGLKSGVFNITDKEWFFTNSKQNRI